MVPEPWCPPQTGRAGSNARRYGRLFLWPVSPGRQDVAEKNKLSQDAKRYGKLLQKKTLQIKLSKYAKRYGNLLQKKEGRSNPGLRNLGQEPPGNIHSRQIRDLQLNRNTLETLPKAQRTRGLSSYQRLSIKHQLQNLNQTSASRLNLK